MIPKTIHYCWFGNKKMPFMAEKCIQSWKNILPDYKLVLWNESNFDIDCNPYTKEAYKNRKFAFVTDYVRLHVLYHYGGIYMDTDVEVLKSLNDLLKLPGFTGFESPTHVPTGIIASEVHNPWIKEQLLWYQDRHFIKEDGNPDFTSNVQVITTKMRSEGFKLNNSYQVHQGFMHFFPKDYFCPKSRSGIITLTPNTYCIHHFAASWHPFHLKIKRFFFRRIIGVTFTDRLINIKQKLKKYLTKK